MGGVKGRVEVAGRLGELLIAGLTVPEAATILDLKPTTALAISKDAACQHILEDHRAAQLASVALAGADAARRAVAVLLQLAEDPDVAGRVRREAASDLLDRFGPAPVGGALVDAAAAGATVGALLARMASAPTPAASLRRVDPPMPNLKVLDL